MERQHRGNRPLLPLEAWLQQGQALKWSVDQTLELSRDLAAFR